MPMKISRITTSRVLNVPTGGGSLRTRRKEGSAPAQTKVVPVRITQNKVRDCSHMGIGKIDADMSRSDECVLATECSFVHVAARAAERGRLVVADDLQVNVQPGGREVAGRLRLPPNTGRPGRDGGAGA